MQLTSSSKDIKNVSDDHLKSLFKEKGYIIDNSYADVRLAIGFASVAVAGLVALGEYKLGYDRIKNEITLGVIFFAILQAAFLFWSSRIEKNAVYIGKHEKTGHKAIVRTSIEKYGVKYSATITITDKKGSVLSETNVEGKANDWIDDSCDIVYPKFAALFVGVLDKESVKSK